MRSGSYCARLATILGSLAVTRRLAHPLNWAAAVGILPIEPPDDELLLRSSPSSPTEGSHRATSGPSEFPFEESFGPTDLISSPVPNEGDVQLLHALNAAIYQSLYSGTEEGRRDRWRRLWRRYYGSMQLGADIILESLPPAHLCPPPPGYPKTTEAKGSFAENILEQQNFIYIAQFSLPPFLFFSKKEPQGLVDIQYVDHTPGHPLVTFGAQQTDTAIMLMGLISRTPYVKRYLSTTCPLMMYGKLTLISGYGHSREDIGAWNSPRVLIGTLTFIRWKEPVAEQLPEARIHEHSSFAQLLAAARHGRIDGLLLPAATASVLILKLGNYFGRYGLSHFVKPRIVGHLGQNNIPIVYTVRKYPMKPRYVNSFFDETYVYSELNCQDIL